MVFSGESSQNKKGDKFLSVYEALMLAIAFAGLVLRISNTKK